MVSFKVKYIKSTKYDNYVFISTDEIDTKSYESLCKVASKIDMDFPDSYLPIYKNTENNTISLTAVPHDEYKTLKKHGVHSIKFNLLKKKKKSDGSTYLALKMRKEPTFIKIQKPVEEMYQYLE